WASESVGNGRRVGMTRGLSVEPREPGESVAVILTLTGVTGPTTVVETFPEGWMLEDSAGGAVSGNTITYNVAQSKSLTYQVASPLFDCAPAIFTGDATPRGGCTTTVVSRSNCRPPECGLQSTGAVSEMLIIGPIDLIDPGNPGVTTGPNCDDNGKLQATDYMDDGAGVTEATLLVEAGDQIAPEFGGAAGGFGVKLAVNPWINPAGTDGILTVWRAGADVDGLIRFNDADNVGDPVDDYIIYGLIYLENTTEECVDAVLEVGSDDAVKMRVNGVLVHVNAVCRSITAAGEGDMVSVSFVPGVNVILVGVVERGGDTDLRLIVRDPDLTPLNDGRVKLSCSPPASYPVVPRVIRSIDPVVYAPDETITITLSAADIADPFTLVETVPAGFAISTSDGTVDGNTITFEIARSGDLTYELTPPADSCDRGFVITGEVLGGGCALLGGDSRFGCRLSAPDCGEESGESADLVAAFAFGVHSVLPAGAWCPVPGDPAVSYTPVEQSSAAALLYSAVRGWGYEQIYSAGASPYGTRGGYGIFGPFDDTPNPRSKFSDACGEQLYDSFIGAKDWLDNQTFLDGTPYAEGQDSCSAATVGDPRSPCATVKVPEGIVFRVDIPDECLQDAENRFRFAAAVGSADNTHAHRILAEAGGAGPPPDVGESHVVLVSNFDQAQFDTGTTDGDPGDGVFARVGFDDKLPPLGDGIAPDPAFINMNAAGLATGRCASSPTLVVDPAEPYIRVHQLQGNSNNGPGGARDPNGGDLVVLEIWKVTGGGPAAPKFVRGDANADGEINLTDGIVILSYLYLGDDPPECMDAADVDDDGGALPTLTDAIRIFSWLFLGQTAPRPPSPRRAVYAPGDCGVDPPDEPGDTPDAMGCAQPPEKCRR
ncbi:MAG: hypothetical protein JXA90_08940, partial [Planctomycetes bacterium]|nr:hypothetical protein [Planctomycetota bacterium]